MNTAMPIGKDDFKELRDGGYYFVDKSETIAKLIDHPAEVTLFTRPSAIFWISKMQKRIETSLTV